jgi:hypothetical protein
MRTSLTLAAAVAAAAIAAAAVTTGAIAQSTPAAVETTTKAADPQAALANIDPATLTDAGKHLLAKVRGWSAADWQAMRSAATASVKKYGVESVLDEQCSPTDFGPWVEKTLGYENWTPADAAAFNFLGNSGAFSMPFLDAILFGSDSKTNTFGPNGEFTNAVRSEMKDLKRFWNIDSATTELVPAHGKDVFTSRERVAKIFTIMFGAGWQGADPENLAWADLILATLGQVPSLQMGASPFFTINAMASPAGKGENPKPARVILGDGLLQGLAALGLGDVGPRVVLAHEFGHEVQFATNTIPEEEDPDPAASRQAELEADAYAAYYLTHSRGGAINAKRVADAAKSAWQFGDCGTTQPGHHGTPAQRERAVLWAAGLVDSASNQGHILPALDFHSRFMAALPGIVAG